MTYSAPCRRNSGVTLVELSQGDGLRAESRGPALDSLQLIVEADGQSGPRILSVAVEHSASTNRLIQNVTVAALATRGAAATESGADAAWETGLPMPTAVAGRQLTGQLAQASGLETVARATQKSYRINAGTRTSWPVTRWLGKLRPDPLRSLNLNSRDVNPAVNRAFLPERGPAQRAQADSAVRTYGDNASTGAPEVWRGAIRRATRSSATTLPDTLYQAVARTDIGAGRGSWWWPVLGVMQWIALAVALGGAGWLAVLALMGYLQLDVPATPRVEGLPVPTLMLIGGVLLGIVLGLAAGLLARAAASRRARRAHKRLTAAIGEAAHRVVAEPVAAEIQRFNDFADAVRRARG